MTQRRCVWNVSYLFVPYKKTEHYIYHDYPPISSHPQSGEQIVDVAGTSVIDAVILASPK